MNRRSIYSIVRHYSKWNMLDSQIELVRTEEEKYMNHGIFDDFHI